MLVTVIIPAYNAQRYLARCLDSIFTIEEEIEVIVVNDGSRDKTKEILDSYQEKHKNLVCIHQNNSGVSYSRNVGLKAAKGEYIMFADADDIFDNEMFKRLIMPLKEKKYDFVFGDYETISENDELYDYMKIEKKLITLKDIKEYFLSYTDLNTCWGKLFKKDIILQYKIHFDTTIHIGEDRAFVGDYITHINNYYYTDNSVYKYRIVIDSVMGSSRTSISDSKISDFVKGFRHRKKFADNNRIDKKALCEEVASETIAMINIMLHGRRPYRVSNEEAHNLLMDKTIKNNLHYVSKLRTVDKKRRIVCRLLTHNIGISLYVFVKYLVNKIK